VKGRECERVSDFSERLCNEIIINYVRNTDPYKQQKTKRIDIDMMHVCDDERCDGQEKSIMKIRGLKGLS